MIQPRPARPRAHDSRQARSRAPDSRQAGSRALDPRRARKRALDPRRARSRALDVLAAAIFTLTSLAGCHEPTHDGAGARVAPAPSPGPLGASAPAPHTALRYVIGGDSRQDEARVVPWALHEARARGATAFFFLGDMEMSPNLDDHFRRELGELGPVQFFPVLGNHEAARRAPGESRPAEARAQAVAAFAARFLGPQGTQVRSAFADKLTYAIDLPGGVHFVALDNVTQVGFGADQLAWLGADLDRARGPAGATHIIVGMHKALAGSGVTTHAMDEDGPAAQADSAAALALFERSRVELIVASHYHGFAEYAQRGIRSFITGGMGAPLDAAHGKASAFHHILVATVPSAGPMTLEVVRFPGAPSIASEPEP